MGVAAQVNLVLSAFAPTSSYIALCDGGPPTMVWLGAPDQGARSSPLRPLGRDGVEIELTTRAAGCNSQQAASKRLLDGSKTLLLQPVGSSIFFTEMKGE